MTRFLLDTCVLIDWAIDPRRLRNQARIAIANGRSQVFVSAATAWEIAIKTSLGKLHAPRELTPLLSANRFLELAITLRHTELLAELPPHHKDPFDRLLIAQAIAEGLTLITRDDVIQQYNALTLAA